jgi:hypothetical protein
VKYALATLENINPQLVSRPDEPDFSDLFILSEADYQKLLAQWAAKLQQESVAGTGGDFKDTHIKNLESIHDANDVNDVNDISGGVGKVGGSNDSNSLTIRGPYGPEWPFVTEPAEFEIGSATVRIEIEDENAKYPLGWVLLGDEAVQRDAQAGFETFCEWVGFGTEDIDSLKKELKGIREVVKPFKVEVQSAAVTERTPSATTPSSAASKSAAARRTARAPVTTRTVPASDSLTRQGADFAEVFHSSLIDTELLARPTIISEKRKESALKYIGVWGSTKVNINTAPRHVLEAAFTFGGDADEIARQIIQRRRVKPFADMEDLRTSLFRYTDSIRKCEKYITTVSNFFTVRVTVISGVAEASSVIAITKDGKTIRRIAVISG